MTRSARINRKPVMVIAGEFWRGSTGLGLADGFRRCGWVVQEIDIQTFHPNLGSKFSERAIRRAVSPLANRAFRSAIVNACETLRPDVFLSIKGTEISPDILQCISTTGACTALFYPDFHFDYPDVDLETLGRFDRIITSKSFHIDFLTQRFGQQKISYIPHGHASDVHQPLRTAMVETDYEVDLQHIGTCSPSKLRWMSKLRQQLPDARMRVIGPGWKRATIGTALEPSVMSGAYYGCGYSEAVQTARINIAVHLGPAGKWQDNVSTRTFEIPACRGFMLHIDNPEVREFFTPRDEIDVFSSSDELAKKAEYYLERPDLRAAMIEQAYQRAVPAYSYDTRAKAILDVIRS